MKLRAPITLLLIFLAVAVQAQEKPQALWSTYGIVVNDTAGNTSQQNPKIVADGAGGYSIIWEDGRSGYYDIYAQKVNGSGQALWTKNGVAACNVPGNQNFPAAASDNANGLIVVWQDYRNGNSDIYAQRLSYAGQPLWGKGGIPICIAETGQMAPEIIADGSGGAVIVWHDYRSGKGEDVYAQKVTASGQVIWQKDGLPVSLAKGTQWYPKLSSDGQGGAIIVWTDSQISSSDNNIFAQHLDANGSPKWAQDGIPVCAADRNQEQPEIISVTDGVIIAWQDSRSKNMDIYAQKIAFNGNIKWAKDGVAVSTYAYPQENPKLSPDGSGGVIIVWTDHRAEPSDIYAQRIYSDGNIAWSENGRPVCKANDEQKLPAITKLITDDWLIVWEDDQGGKLKTDLYAQKINSSGTPLWDPRGLPIASSREQQKSPAVATTPKGNVIVAWEDHRTGNSDVYAQKVAGDTGQLLWSASGVVVSAASGSVVQQNVELTPTDKGEIILVFEDARSGYFNIYAQKITKAGSLAWGEHGIPVAKVAANQTKPQLVSDSKGGAIIAWEDNRIEGRPIVRVQRLSSQGKNLWESSQPVALAKGGQTDPLMVSDNKGGAIIAWRDGRNALSLGDIYAQRISGAGKLLWDKKGKIIVAANGEQVEADMISDGLGGAILAWTDFRRGDRNPDIYSQRIDAKGKPLWQEDGVLVCGAPDVQRTPKIISDDQGGVIISWTDKGGGSYDIYAQRINKAGKPVWMTDGIPINQLSRTQQNAKFGNKKVLVWEDYRYGNWDIFASAVSPDGKLLWKDDGIPVALIPHTQYAPQITSWKNDSVIIAWEDYRSGKHYEIFVQRLNNQGEALWEENGLKVRSRNGGRAPKIVATPSSDSFYVFWEDYTDGGKAIFGQRYLLY